MARYIDVDKLLEKTINVFKVVRVSDIKSIPTEDVAPVKHGKWILLIAGVPDPLYDVNRYQCSCCGYVDQFSTGKNVPYCWHCVAKMDGKVEGKEEH